MMEEPKLNVGIMNAETIHFVFDRPYRCGQADVVGPQTATCQDGRVFWNGQKVDDLLFSPIHKDDTFELVDVTIGINFHWERKENQRFKGALKIIADQGRLIVINVVLIEDYLTSVISSEMSAKAGEALSMAHTVIARSWILAQIRKEKTEKISSPGTVGSERVMWYDRDDHTLFDVCADDHCQRYQGVTRASTPAAQKAVSATRGETLMFNQKICDARYAKCCGGMMEEFKTCWGDEHHPYLVHRLDRADQTNTPDLTQHEQAEAWIRSSQQAFCNTQDRHILTQVLNDYDQETPDFYRWTVTYTRAELSALVRERSGLDFGDITDLIPLNRGPSGRIYRLRVVGTKRDMVIGKELEIRRTLSKSHLYSAAFVVDRDGDRFIITGAGWGHGVGLCQIGAALMGAQGYAYRDILGHYYPGAELTKLY